MTNARCFALYFLAAAACLAQSAGTGEWHDPSPHTASFVAVDQNVKLEVLDFGGSGVPIVLLAGLGNTAHVFDDFAPKLTADHRVYAITRRGFGASTAPASGYSADRLGDDVLAVLDSLSITRPILIGHSIAGEELSSIGSRHPEKVAALVYLDAANQYAYYDSAHGDLLIDGQSLEGKLGQLLPGGTPPPDRKRFIEELLRSDLPRFQSVLRTMLQDIEASAQYPPERIVPGEADRASFSAYRQWQSNTIGVAMPEADLRQSFDSTPEGGVGKPRNQPAVLPIMKGEQKYTNIPVPTLAIFALPRDVGRSINRDPAARATAESYIGAKTEIQASAFEKGVPHARVVRLPEANHYVFLSNEADVLREMRAFVDQLR
jgi:pimeloyl-ACP methyl ester carboxylesterase